ncbi:predicted protein [Naegleria gruberi]|uniref:Predicted protein n=1 Tax=Naegleria gruberi TaxID=5762 RepID=D2W0X3_NAEGR|nr:uncharacterized protein NAEGRDRAFT_59791 [Naegleria gruberi]EFC37255.1 predicted protein [Naegleria gruberi]|eukprot:XP_002669999.1 predicted protein [Naegleria gruberi strain NEG-M]
MSNNQQTNVIANNVPMNTNTCLQHLPTTNMLPSIKDLVSNSHPSLNHLPPHESQHDVFSTQRINSIPNIHSNGSIANPFVVTSMDTLKHTSPPVLRPSQISHVIYTAPSYQQPSKMLHQHVASPSNIMELKQDVILSTTNYQRVNMKNEMQDTSNMHMSKSQFENINLEHRCEQQMLIINQLQMENKQLKDEIAQFKRKRDECIRESTPTKRKTSNSNGKTPSSSSTPACITFSSMAFDESSSSDHSEIDPSQMVVNWGSKTYYLVGAFKAISSRTRVLVNFVPMFEKEFPEKECKLVLTSEEFKRLAKENPHLFKQSKHTWRVSLFSSDFYQYVKAKTGH